MPELNWDKVGIDISKQRGGKMKCPVCGHKSNSLSVNLTTGLYKCHYHACDFKGCVVERPQYQPKRKDWVKPKPRERVLCENVVNWFASRGISEKTLTKMRITESDERFGEYVAKAVCFNYYRDNVLVNIKFRSPNKKFKMSANAELIPYNIDASKGEEELVWVEGEIDLLSCLECGIKNVVSVPNGAAGDQAKLEYIDNCWIDIEHIKKHIISVDDDAAGKKLKEALTYRLGVENCWFVKYPENRVVDEDGGMRSCKDLNEVLMNFGKEQVVQCVEEADQPPIKGVHYALDVAEPIFDIFANGVQSGETTHYPEFDKIFKWKRRDINLVIGHGNYGKTQKWLEFMLVKSMYDGWKWGIFSPENYPATDFFIDVIEMYVGKHIDDRMSNKMNADELADAIEFLNDHFIYVYPDEAHDLATIHTIFRSLILRHGIDGFLIDPWNQLDHIIDNREDLYLSKALKDIKKFATVNNVSYNIIAHPRTIAPNKDGELPEIQVWHIAGGIMWNNKVDQILSVERPDWYRDKSSGLTRVKSHKVKRRRTGGSLNETDFDYMIRQSRYCETGSDKIICDPKRAAIYKEEPAEQMINRSLMDSGLDDLSKFEGF
jgi:twinkle protein